VSEKMAYFGPEWVAQFGPESVAHFGPEWVAQFGPEYANGAFHPVWVCAGMLLLKRSLG
jgi:hypothetical protein